MTDETESGLRFGLEIALEAIIALYLLYQIHRRGSAAPMPPEATSKASANFYRAQLERRRDALRSIWRWYAGPCLAALLAFALCVPLANPNQPGLWGNITPFVVLSVLWALAAWRLAQRGARSRQHQIDGLEGLDKQ